MATQIFRLHQDGNLREVQVDSDAYLSDVRGTLDIPFYSYHFVYFNSVLETKQVLNDQRWEASKRLRDGFVFPPNSILLANMSESHPDFFGHRVDTFRDRHMGVQVRRNTVDAKPAPSDFDPIMLNEVAMANPDTDLAFDRVVICQAGSLLQFDLYSWGAAGWGYSVRSDRDIIVDKLYRSYTEQDYGSAQWLTLRRYQDTYNQPGPTIRVDALTKSQLAGGFTAEYSKLTVRTWRVSSYGRDSRTFSSDLQPPSTVRAIADAEGDTFVSGGASGRTDAGETSSQTFGTIHDIVEDGPDQVLGAVTFFLFVVRDRQQVNELLKIVNSAEAEPFPTLSPDSIGLTNGTYRRIPVENDWHTGTIGPDPNSDGKLRWTNAAGVSWTLVPDLNRNSLRKEPGSPYDDSPNGREFKIVLHQERLQVDGFEFNGEFYTRDQ